MSEVQEVGASKRQLRYTDHVNIASEEVRPSAELFNSSFNGLATLKEREESLGCDPSDQKESPGGHSWIADRGQKDSAACARGEVFD